MLPQTELVKQLLLPNNGAYSPINFVKLIEDLYLNYESQIRNDIKGFLEEMDTRFRDKPGRKNRYYVAYTGKITIIRM